MIPSRTRWAAVDAALERAVAAREVPGVAAAVTDASGPIYEAAFGVAATALPAPMRTDTVFRIASMTKPITALAILLLSEEGKLALDDPLAAHLPGFAQPGVLTSFDERTRRYSVRDAKRAITIRDLLTHTSGFGYWFLDRELLLEAQGRAEHFRAPFLMHDPGERFSYGISTDVLGLVVEPVSGLTLERFIDERLCRPLGLEGTGFEPPRAAGRLATLHVRRGDGFVDRPNERVGEGPRGGGGLYSTVRDYAAVMRLLLSRGKLDDGTRLLSEESVESMTTNRIGALFARPPTSAFEERTLDFGFLDGTQRFGFNVAIETRDGPYGRSAGSYGWGGIFNTFFWVDPRAGVGAVLMMQVSPFCEPGCLSVYRGFERAVYRALDGR